MAAKRDYYDILSVDRGADGGAIKKAYRTLAKKYHPDLNPGDTQAEESFKEASEAYEVLKDPQKRATYDQFGHEGLKNQGFQGFHNMEDVFSTFGDVFESFFGGGGSSRARRDGPRKGADLEYHIQIELEDAYQGVKQTFDLQLEKDCQPCEGQGHEPGHPPATCPTCKGYGQVQQNRGFISLASTCPTCRGAGKKIDKPCIGCKGVGRVKGKETIELDIPPGIDTGMHLRVSNKGHGGSKGGPAGDLYVLVEVKEHANFVRQEEHLYSTVNVGMAQASLGCKVHVDTMSGTQDVEIPKGTQNGEQVTLNQAGMPSLRGGRAGNQYVQVNVMIPKRLSSKQEELLRAFAQESGENVSEAKRGFFGKK